MKQYKNLIFISLLWLFSIISFLKQNVLYTSLLFYLILIFQISSIIFNYKNISHILPFSILLSPIFGSIRFFGLNILISDFLVFYSLLVLFIIKNKTISHSRFFYFLLFCIISHSFFHYIFGDLQNLKPIISIIQIFIVYILYKEVFKNISINLFFISCILSVLLGIYLMTSSYYIGINLNNFTGDALKINSEDYDVDSYRVGFFYTNFPFIISCSIFLLSYFFQLAKQLKYQLIILIFIIISFLAIIISGNKTTLIVTVLILLSTELYRKFSIRKIFKYAIIVTLIIFLINYLLYNFFLNDYTRGLFENRMLSNDSLIDRFGVYYNVYDILIRSPLRLFFGYGPDFLTGAGSHEASFFKINYFTKTEQGAVDSGILTFIIEFGLLLFLIIIFPIIMLVKNLFKNNTLYNLLALRLMFVFILTGFTQLIGLSKIFWFFAIFYALYNNPNFLLSYKIKT